MKYSLLDHALIAFCVVALACGQLTFKFVGIRLVRITDLANNMPLLAAFAGAVALYGMSTLVWVDVLRRVPLNYAYMFMALGFFIVPLASSVLFQEQMTTRLLIGAGVVVVGLIIAVT